MFSKKLHDLKQCELCGRMGKLVETIIEGSFINVCQYCAGFGKTVVLQKKTIDESPPRLRKILVVEERELVSREYPRRIKESREKHNLKQKELAEKIGERESVVHQLESGNLEPSLALAKKLEHFLDITLIEHYEEKNEQVNLSNSSLTIGDILKLKKKTG